MPAMVTATPSQLGRYQILDEIGKGAMGVVYLAKDPLIGRLVALKTFHLTHAIRDEELIRFRERFMREAQSAGILSHPNIVTIHDVVEESVEGATFIAMEYVRGSNLKDLLAGDKPLDLPFIADVVWQVCEALDYAHSKGVVHRDIKPANILITADERVKITDFGIARINTSNLTQEGQLLGTPNYMAPEQIQGREVDHRADIFALGVVLYEMLTRHKPFAGDSLTVVTHRIVYEAPTPPEQYLAHFPAGLMEVLGKALAKEPDRRFQRAGELAREVQEISDRAAAEAALSETQEIEPPPLPPPVSVPLARRLSAALAGLGAGLRRRLPPPERRPPPLRLGLVALGAAVAAGLGGWLALAWVAGGGAVPLPDAEHRHRLEILPYLKLGHQRLAEGEPEAAAVAFAQAERLAPERARIRDLRWQAELQAELLASAELREEEAAALLAAGEEDLAGGRYAAAVTAANRVLERQPADPVALDLLARAEAAEERRRAASAARARPAPPPAPAPEPAAEAAPTEAAAPAPPAAAPDPVPVATTATLAIRFYSELPQGVLTIYAGATQLLREPFQFYEREGLFRSRRAVPGELERTVEVPAGEVSLRVYVALERTLLQEITGSFPGGATRALDIRLGEDGRLTASLR